MKTYIIPQEHIKIGSPEWHRLIEQATILVEATLIVARHEKETSKKEEPVR